MEPSVVLRGCLSKTIFLLFLYKFSTKLCLGETGWAGRMLDRELVHGQVSQYSQQHFALLQRSVLPCWPNRRRRACSSRKWESSSWRISHRAKPTSRIAATVGTTSDQRVALNSSCSLSWERPPQVRHCNTHFQEVKAVQIV
jgi:hypothetical protein